MDVNKFDMLNWLHLLAQQIGKKPALIIYFDVHNEPISRTIAMHSLVSGLLDTDCKSVLLTKLTWESEVI